MLKKILFCCLVLILAGGLFAEKTYAQSVEESMAAGSMLLQNGYYSEAVTAYRNVLNREPDNFEARFNLGAAYYKWGRYNSAVVEFKTCIRYQAYNADVWHYLGLCYEGQNNLSEANKCYLRAVQFLPSNSQYYISMGRLAEKQNNFEEALMKYQQAEKIDSGSREAKEGIIRCCGKLGKADCVRFRKSGEKSIILK